MRNLILCANTHIDDIESKIPEKNISFSLFKGVEENENCCVDRNRIITGDDCCSNNVKR